MRMWDVKWIGCKKFPKNIICICLKMQHSFFSEYKGKPLGTIGNLGTYSFHETKNLISGKGGCLILNEIAEIIREKGTN